MCHAGAGTRARVSGTREQGEPTSETTDDADDAEVEARRGSVRGGRGREALLLALSGCWAACWVLVALVLANVLLTESGMFVSSFGDDREGESGWFLLLALVLTPLLVGIAGAFPARLLGGSWLRGALAMNGAGIVAALVARSLPSDGLRVSALIVLWMTVFLLLVMAQVGTTQPTQVAVLLAVALMLLVVSVVPRSTPWLGVTAVIVWSLLPAVTRVRRVSTPADI